MPRYQIEFLASARKELKALNRASQPLIAAKIDALADEPRPANATKLVGSEYWRIRVGDYRVIYGIEDAKLVVLVVRVGHRREVYR